MSNADQSTGKVEVVWHAHRVTRAARETLNGHSGCVVWFTGLSGCGKSTIANLVEGKLHQRRVHSFLLDGDNVRHGLNASPEMLADRGPEYARRFGLGFSAQDRAENIRRIGAVAELLAEAGLVVLAAFVSPFRADRDDVRRRIEGGSPGSFIEAWLDAPLDVCESRDPKGLYQKARAGLIGDFTGISAPYERPLDPELQLRTDQATADALADAVIAKLVERRIVPGP